MNKIGVIWLLGVVFVGLTLSLIILLVKNSIQLKVYAAIDEQSNWVKISSLPEQFISTLAVQGDRLLAGSNSPKGGIYKSNDDGKTWTYLGLEKRIIEDILIVSDTIYVASATNDGVFKSIDDGNTWVEIGPTVKIKTLFKTDSKLFAGSSNGIYLSKDEGNNWEKSGLENVNIKKISGFGSNLLVAAGTSYPSNWIYNSTDGGSTWKFIRGNGEYLISPLFNKTVFSSFHCCFNQPTLIRSEDEGFTWNLVKNWPIVAAKPGPFAKMEDIIYTGGYRSVGGVSQIGIYRSSDDGNNWELFSDGLNLDSSSTLSLQALIGDEKNLTLYAAITGKGIWKRKIPINFIKREPIILIPGGGGSELYATTDINASIENGHNGLWNHVYKKDEKIWVNLNAVFGIKPLDLLNNDDYFDVLKLNNDGISSKYSEIKPKSLLYTVIPNRIEPYAKWKHYWENQGYTYGKDLFDFPYDFRKDVAQSINEFDELVKFALIKVNDGEQNRTKWKIKKVNLITHSLGGSLARSYITDPEKAININKLVTLAPAFLGSPQYLKAILFGDDVGSRSFINPSEFKDVIQNWPGAFEVMPSELYWQFYDDSTRSTPVPFKEDRDFDNNGITPGSLDYKKTKQLLKNSGSNMIVYNIAESFHNSVDLTWKDGLQIPEVHIVAGVGVCTAGQLRAYNSIKKSLFNRVELHQKIELIHINGDGTVPLFSATLEDQNRDLDFNHNSFVYFTNLDHSSIPINENVLQLTSNILNHSTDIPASIKRTNTNNCDGKVISIESPVDLHLYDKFGRHTGLSDYENEFGKRKIVEKSIPGSTYEQLGESKYIFLPNEGEYNIVLNATGKGSFTLKIRSYSNNKQSKIINYLNIPINKQTIGKLFFDTQVNNPPILEIDFDGDGIYETKINASSVLDETKSDDSIGPQITILSPMAVHNPLNLIPIKWEVIDGVSGVFEDSGYLDYETNFFRRVNNGELVILEAGEHTLTVFAVDNLGNATKSVLKFTIHNDMSINVSDVNNITNYIYPISHILESDNNDLYKIDTKFEKLKSVHVRLTAVLSFPTLSANIN